MATVIISTTLAMSDYADFASFAKAHDLTESTALRLIIKDFLDSADPKRILEYRKKAKDES